MQTWRLDKYIYIIFRMTSLAFRRQKKSITISSIAHTQWYRMKSSRIPWIDPSPWGSLRNSISAPPSPWFVQFYNYNNELYIISIVNRLSIEYYWEDHPVFSILITGDAPSTSFHTERTPWVDWHRIHSWWQYARMARSDDILIWDLEERNYWY